MDRDQYKEFGRRLRELRKERGLTQRELADEVDLDFTYISKIENGLLPPPREPHIIKLAQILQASEEELLLLARKVPESFKEEIATGGTLPAFLRLKRDLNNDMAEKLEGEFKEFVEKWKKRQDKA